MGEIQGYGNERYLFGCIVKASLDSILRMILKKRKGHSNMKNYRAELTGVFGDPVDDNPTGVVEEAAFAAKNLNYRYLTIKVLPEDLGKAMDSVKIFGMKGINLTMPHKIKVLPYLDELSPAAEIIGAVNTVIQKEGKLFGENTDGKGFVTALKNSGETLDKKNVTILGAGGAARAIAVECACDVIFNPAETIFLKSAAENGAKTITGLGMLVQQAALNFTLWTGVEAPVDVMEDALKKEFE